MSKVMVAAAAVVLVAGGVLATVAGGWMFFNRGGRAVSGGGETPVVDDGTWRKADWLREYKLTERSGRTFDSHELDGQVYVASFFYSDCPLGCSQQNAAVRDTHRQFADKGVKFVSITCDPAKDTPEVLRDYAHRFEADENWYFLTGDLLDIRRIGAEVYQVGVEEKTHSERLIVVDRAGEIRGHFAWNEPEEMTKMRDLLAKLVQEGKPQS